MLSVPVWGRYKHGINNFGVPRAISPLTGNPTGVTDPNACVCGVQQTSPCNVHVSDPPSSLVPLQSIISVLTPAGLAV